MLAQREALFVALFASSIANFDLCIAPLPWAKARVLRHPCKTRAHEKLDSPHPWRGVQSLEVLSFNGLLLVLCLDRILHIQQNPALRD